MRNVREATDVDVMRVCGRLRPVDIEEQFARLSIDSGAELAVMLLRVRYLAIGRFAICTPDGQPQTILSAYRTGDQTAALHRISTDRWDDVSRTVFLFGVRHFVPEVLRPNVSRATCSVLARHEAAHAMLRRLGFAATGIEPARGKRGEEFMGFSWTNEGAVNV